MPIKTGTRGRAQSKIDKAVRAPVIKVATAAVPAPSMKKCSPRTRLCSVKIARRRESDLCATATRPMTKAQNPMDWASGWAA